MCDHRPARPVLTRRTLLGAGAALGAHVVAGAGPARAQAHDERPIGGGHAVITRASWGGDLPPTGPLEAEAPGDVRFVLVHHTVTANGYAPGAVEGELRSIHRFHTGQKGWADVAYNFFVDAQGRIWEGRTGSLDAPVKGDATGGSQGFAQLCCFIGDHQTVAPTPAAQAAMAALIAWLTDRYGIPVEPGATATFTSRGSQRHPAGATVTTRTIAGHREMSATVCPGDAAFVLLEDDLPVAVRAARSSLGSGAPPAVATTEASTTTTTSPPTTGDATSTTAGPTTITSGAPTSGPATTPPFPSSSSTTPATLAEGPPTDGTGQGAGIDPLIVVAGAALVGVAGTAGFARRTRRQADPDDDPGGTTS